MAARRSRPMSGAFRATSGRASDLTPPRTGRLISRRRDLSFYLGCRFLSTARDADPVRRHRLADLSTHAFRFRLALVGLCQFVPMFPLTLPAGDIADRFDPRRVLSFACRYKRFAERSVPRATRSQVRDRMAFLRGALAVRRRAGLRGAIVPVARRLSRAGGDAAPFHRAGAHRFSHGGDRRARRLADFSMRSGRRGFRTSACCVFLLAAAGSRLTRRPADDAAGFRIRRPDALREWPKACGSCARAS